MFSEDKTRVPKVYISVVARKKLDSYIDICRGEVSALGKVSKINGDLLVEDVFLFNQEVSSASTDLSVDDLSKFTFEYIKMGKSPEDIKLWWHSHADLDVGWSSIDNANIESIGNEWMLSIVSNRFGEHRARLDIYEPIRITIDNLAIETKVVVDPMFKETIRKEVNQKVRPMGWFRETKIRMEQRP